MGYSTRCDLKKKNIWNLKIINKSYLKSRVKEFLVYLSVSYLFCKNNFLAKSLFSSMQLCDYTTMLHFRYPIILLNITLVFYFTRIKTSSKNLFHWLKSLILYSSPSISPIRLHYIPMWFTWQTVEIACIVHSVTFSETYIS